MASSDAERSSVKYCSWCKMCKLWWKAFKWLPVLLIIAIIVWSYYAYVLQLCIKTIESTIEQVLYLIFYHILLVMLLWSYYRTVFTPIVSVPDKFKLPDTEIEKLLAAETEEAQRVILENFAKDLPVTTRTMSSAIRYCNRCVLIKPDRAHHCSMCGTCVLKMDHHCPWVNNCVCYHNYKFFILFLGYGLFYCAFIMGTSMPYFIKFWKESARFTNAGLGGYHIVFVFFVSLMFGISLASLYGYHCYLVMQNRTTLEAFRSPVFRSGIQDKNGFSIGTYKNLVEVFGENIRLWPLPIFTSLGDGVEYPVRHEHQLQNYVAAGETRGYESMGVTRSSEEESWRLCPTTNGRANAQIV